MITHALITVAEHGEHWGPFGGGPGFFWPIFPIVWFLLVAAGIVTAILLVRGNRRAAPRREAEARLSTRYASGEIGEEEYRSRLSVLRDKR